MGKNSHGKRSDKETQSPLLKIFKEIMQKENNDLEKATLVRKKRKKKRKQYSSNKSNQKSGESSGIDRMKKNAQYSVMEKNRAYSGSRTQSNPFPSEKRESWWLWGESCSKKPEENSTCSCVSCQLKKILSNEYACIGCLIVVFTISVLVAFLLVFKTITTVPETEHLSEKYEMKNKLLDSNSMTDKLNKLQALKKFTDYKKMDFGRETRRSIWDENLKNLDARLAESDLADNQFQDMDLVQSASSPNSDLSSLLDPSKLNDAQASSRLKNFYKKLLETDAQIKNLKNGVYDNPSVTNLGNKNSLFRLKRSLFHHHKASKKGKKEKTTITTVAIKHREQTKKLKKEGKQDSPNKKVKSKTSAETKETKTGILKQHHILDGILEIKDNEGHKKQKNEGRHKRFDNETEPRGIVFEKKQLIVQYLDKKPKFPKCTHSPKEFKSNGHPMKYPLYKNTGRLDELLDEFLDRDVHEMVSDQFGIDKNLGKQKKSKCKMQHHLETATTTTDTTDLSTAETTVTNIKTMPSLATKPMQFSFPTERLYEKYLRPNVARAKKLRNDLTKFLKPESTVPKREYSPSKKGFNENDDFDYMTSPSYEIVLSISTLMNPEIYEKRSTNYESELLLAKLPSRKLMQTDEEDDEALGYEDFKEVVSDDMATHHEADREVEMKKREGKLFNDMPATPTKYNPPGVFNPNWKGPVPLYPDELNSMMKHPDPENEPIENTTGTSYRQIQTHSTDIEYIEEYQNLKNMAQAYSDYGVLEGKKDVLKNIKTQNKGDGGVKMFIEDIKTTVDNRVKKDFSTDDLVISFNIIDGDSTSLNDDSSNSGEGNELFDDKTTTGFDLLVFKNNSHKRSINIGMDKINAADATTEIKIYRNTESELTDPNNIIESGFQSASDSKIPLQELSENISDKSKHDKKANKKMDATEFLSFLSSWFNTLAGVSVDSRNGNKTRANSTKLMKNLNTSLRKDNVSKDIVYPLYDSDMIDNIGHRSRVLMSLDDAKENIDNKETSDGVTWTNSIMFATADISAPTLSSTNREISNGTKRDKNTLLDKQEKDKKVENKTLVKRSASKEPNLVFWNDIYDDEYGIKIDPVDEKVGDKRSLGDLSGDVVKKSAFWIQDKMKMVKDTIKKKSMDSFNKYYNTKKDFGSGGDINKVLHKISKREGIEEQGDPDQKASFAVLTAHMQEICKQASDAVQQTRNIRQNEDHDSQLASGMMQQLVKLMSELVDFEVQQKTCLRLPSDLKEFLEWLTMPVPTFTPQPHAQNLNIMPSDEDKLHMMDLVTTSSSEQEEMRTDARSECLGTLHAVQTLIQEYSQLSDEDKIKMGGVKEYLEDQLDYLNKQLSSIDELNLANIYAKGLVPFRFRRDALKPFEHKWRRKQPSRYLKRRLKRKLNKFMKNFAKKHTRTTPNSFESFQVSTEPFEKKKQDTVNIDVKEISQYNKLLENADQDIDSSKNNRNVKINDGHKEKTKRNLQDIYYRALADAKKMSTTKHLDKSDFERFDKATTVRLEPRSIDSP